MDDQVPKVWHGSMAFTKVLLENSTKDILMFELEYTLARELTKAISELDIKRPFSVTFSGFEEYQPTPLMPEDYRHIMYKYSFIFTRYTEKSK